MTRIVGIDLGTTNSLCAVFDQAGPKLISNSVGDVLTPSVVGVLPDGRVLVGPGALEMRVHAPERCASKFKRGMGLDGSFTVADKSFTAPELSSLVLKALAQDARAHLGENVTDAVVTVPAYFNDNQRKATRLAGKLAGLNIRRIINEPTAAALTYGYHEKEADKKILVFDLGGGTFDVTVMEIFEGSLEIIATAGASQLGGEDFTEALALWVLTHFGLDPHTVEDSQPLRYSRLLKECETAKVQLSTSEDADLRLPDEQGAFPDDAPRVAINRSQFRVLAKDLIARMERPLLKAMADAQCGPEDVEDVILVGGATRMFLVNDYLTEIMGKPPLSHHDPDLVVAMGAAIQAALMDDHEAVEDMVLTDVCPFTLGVEITKRMGSNLRDGYYLPIIHRNTTVPVSREEAVSTVHDNQTTVDIKIYQGESRKIDGNLLLGNLEVNGIPPAPAGSLIYIRFTYDMNGILEVEAIVDGSGEKHRHVLTQHVRGLSEAAIAKAVEHMQDIKFYPRDDQAQQQLLQFAESVVGEISPDQRRHLEEAVDAFERALFGTDKERVTAMREHLLEILDQMGFPFDSGES